MKRAGSWNVVKWKLLIHGTWWWLREKQTKQQRRHCKDTLGEDLPSASLRHGQRKTNGAQYDQSLRIATSLKLNSIDGFCFWGGGELTTTQAFFGRVSVLEFKAHKTEEWVTI
jgi:hypothetical protein